VGCLPLCAGQCFANSQEKSLPVSLFHPYAKFKPLGLSRRLIVRRLWHVANDERETDMNQLLFGNGRL